MSWNSLTYFGDRCYRRPGDIIALFMGLKERANHSLGLVIYFWPHRLHRQCFKNCFFSAGNLAAQPMILQVLAGIPQCQPPSGRGSTGSEGGYRRRHPPHDDSHRLSPARYDWNKSSGVAGALAEAK